MAAQKVITLSEHSESKGFTLVELLVVVAIIGILSAIGMSVFSQAQKSARDAKRRADLHDIQTALELYYSKYKAYPSTGALVSYSSEPGDVIGNNSGNWIPGLASDFIKKLPRDPKGGVSPIQPRCGIWKSAYLYLSDGASYALLAHCSPETEDWNSNDALIDSVRPTWALKVCDGPPGCTW